MSISRQTLSVVIVTFKSDQVIDDCIQSIPEQTKIIIIENSNDQKFKENIEKKYNNVKCILSKENLGMGSGNNFGLQHVKTDYAIILNPDVILEKNSINEIIEATKNINSFAVLAPLSIDPEYPNYKIHKKNLENINDILPFKVNSVDGYAMLLNLKRLAQIKTFKDHKYFDENFFMYLENDDFCKRVIENNEDIFVVPKSKVKHLGAKAVNQKYEYEIELSRNWHWIWSKFYYNKKHHGIFKAINDGFIRFILNTFKYLFFLLTNNKYKKKIYYNRISGFYNALIGKKSWYRPNFKN